jgi:hypothetical protein
MQHVLAMPQQDLSRLLIGVNRKTTGVSLVCDLSARDDVAELFDSGLFAGAGSG